MSELMKPMQIGKVTIKNRFAMAPMAIGSYITSEDELTKRRYRLFCPQGTGWFWPDLYRCNGM